MTSPFARERRRCILLSARLSDIIRLTWRVEHLVQIYYDNITILAPKLFTCKILDSWSPKMSKYLNPATRIIPFNMGLTSWRKKPRVDASTLVLSFNWPPLSLYRIIFALIHFWYKYDYSVILHVTWEKLITRLYYVYETHCINIVILYATLAKLHYLIIFCLRNALFRYGCHV